MEREYSSTISYGFIISQIHCKANTLLKESDYKNLLTCNNLEDLVVKLSQTPYSAFLTEGIKKTKQVFKRKLEASFKSEFNEILSDSSGGLHSLLIYFKEKYQIESFGYVIASRNKINEEEIGFFPEINTFLYSKDLSEIKNLLKSSNNFLYDLLKEAPFGDEIDQIDTEFMLSYLHKVHLEKFYKRKIDSETLSEILKYEGDRMILEILLNTDAKNRELLFPTITTFTYSILSKLVNISDYRKLISVLRDTKYSELSKVKSVSEFFKTLNSMEYKIYNEAFNRFNDVASVYVYFKNKEQEVRNILMVIDCIVLGKKNFASEIIVVDKE